jgi:hypothetical protein
MNLLLGWRTYDGKAGSYPYVRRISTDNALMFRDRGQLG